MAAFPLWAPDNTTQFSSVFYVPPGFSCLLTADGLSSEKYRTSASDIKTVQTACVRRLIYDFDKQQASSNCKRLSCDWIYDIPHARAEETSNIQMYTCCEPWALSKLNNIKAIGIPGAYCVMLNDPTAVGVAQVYAEQIANGDVHSTAIGRLYFP